MTRHQKTQPNAGSVLENQTMLTIKVRLLKHIHIVPLYIQNSVLHSCETDQSSSFSCIQMSRPETLASSFSSCAWLPWWLAWVGLLFIVSLERHTQTCVPTSRKTWTFTLDLYDEEWTLSHSGSLRMHRSSYFMQWNSFFLSFPMINNSIPLAIICTNAHYQTGLNKCCFSEFIQITQGFLMHKFV